MKLINFYHLFLCFLYIHLYILSGDGVGAGVCSVTVIIGFGKNARSGLVSGARVDIPQYLKYTYMKKPVFKSIWKMKQHGSLEHKPVLFYQRVYKVQS